MFAGEESQTVGTALNHMLSQVDQFSSSPALGSLTAAWVR